MQLRCGERAAAQDFLIDEPLVVVFVKLGFESRIGNVIGGGPLPDIPNHLVTTKEILAAGESTNRRRRPQAILKQISFRRVNRIGSRETVAAWLFRREAAAFSPPGWAGACRPRGKRGGLKETRGNRLVGAASRRMQAGEVSDQPLSTAPSRAALPSVRASPFPTSGNQRKF